MLKENKDTKLYPIPSFKENNIPIIFASNDGFACFLAIAIQSIISNAEQNNNYDIFILDAGISLENKAIIEKLVHNKTNFHISYCDMQPYLQDVDKSLLELTCAHYSIASWFRIFIPRIFKHFDKVIYLDCDLVLLSDISALWNIDTHGHALAACREFITALTFYTYATQVLNLKDAGNYFNSGVLIFNIGNVLNNSLEDKCLKALRKIEKPICPDQDILNIVFENNVEYLDVRWNVRWMRENTINSLDSAVRDELMKASASPKLVHYIGIKPIHAVDCNLGQYFWKYAEQTPLYMSCLEDLLAYLIPRMRAEDATMGKDPKLETIEKTLWKYFILSKISLGEEKEKYENVYHEYLVLLEKMQNYKL